MDSVIKFLENFLGRDLMYLIGGSSVIVSFAYLFNITTLNTLDFGPLLFIAGISYVLGYLISDGISLTPITSMGKFEPNRFIRCLFKKYAGTAWETPSASFDMAKALVDVH